MDGTGVDAEGRVVNGKRPSSRTLRSISPIRSAGGATNPEVVDAIIARLSLETGPHFQKNGTSSNDDNSDGHGHGAWTDSGEEDGLLRVRVAVFACVCGCVCVCTYVCLGGGWHTSPFVPARLTSHPP